MLIYIFYLGSPANIWRLIKTLNTGCYHYYWPSRKSSRTLHGPSRTAIKWQVSWGAWLRGVTKLWLRSLWTRVTEAGYRVQLRQVGLLGGLANHTSLHRCVFGSVDKSLECVCAYALILLGLDIHVTCSAVNLWLQTSISANAKAWLSCRLRPLVLENIKTGIRGHGVLGTPLKNV